MAIHTPADSTVRDYSPWGWVSSLLFHGLLLTSLAVLVNRTPSGAARVSNLQAGLILRIEQDAAQDQPQEEELAAANASDSSEEQEPLAVSIERIEEPAEEPPPAAEIPEVESQPAPDEAVVEKPLIIRSGSIFEGTSQGELGNVPSGGKGRWPRVTGGQARVSVFGVEGVGTKFVYLFDRSVSMEGTPLAAAKSELMASLKSLDSIHQFQILFFNHRLTIFDHTAGYNRIAFATDDNKEHAASFVSTVSADGGTDRFAAIGQALRLRPDVIFFLTDADDPMPASELAELARRNRRIGASLNTIEFGRGPSRGEYNFLVRLAEQNGGQYGYVDTRKLGVRN